MELKLRKLSLNPYNQENRFPGAGLTHFKESHAQLNHLRKILVDKTLSDNEFLQIVIAFYEVLGGEDKVTKEELLKVAKETLTSERVSADIIAYIEDLKSMGEAVKGVIAAEISSIKQRESVLRGMDSSLNGAMSSLNSDEVLGR